LRPACHSFENEAIVWKTHHLSSPFIDDFIDPAPNLVCPATIVSHFAIKVEATVFIADIESLNYLIQWFYLNKIAGLEMQREGGCLR
jgi:hypothetical protein